MLLYKCVFSSVYPPHHTTNTPPPTYHPQHTEERILQLLRMCNRLLDRHPGTRKRALRYHTPLVVPVWQSIRLVEDDPANVTYGEAYELNCARYGRDPERPITAFREKLPEFAAQPAVDPEGKPIDPRLSAFKYVEAKHVVCYCGDAFLCGGVRLLLLRWFLLYICFCDRT